MYAAAWFLSAFWVLAQWQVCQAFAPHLNMNNATFTNLLANISNPGYGFPPQFSTRKTYFYGGSYVTAPSNDSQHIFEGAMYAEGFTPEYPGVTQPNSIVLVHGAGGSGHVWLDTPDQRQGWVDMFLYLGYAVYVVDMSYMGRSPKPSWVVNETYLTEEFFTDWFTASEKQKTPLWPQAKLHSQFPGSGTPTNAQFDTFYRGTFPTPDQYVRKLEQAMRTSLTALLKEIGKSTVIAHSMGALGAWQAADEVPELFSSLVLLEPIGPPFEDVLITAGADRGMGLTNTLLTYDPPLSSANNLQTERVGDGVGPGAYPESGQFSCVQQKQGTIKKLKNIAQVKHLYVLSEASFVATYAHCTINYLEQCGVSVSFMDLKEEGVRGNGHFFFLEKNSRTIFNLVARWIYDEQISITQGGNATSSSSSLAPIATSMATA